jgi:Zn-dependent peptidase ImmA (M78 family)/transcriptional regulator with XRE-family HTH domain
MFGERIARARKTAGLSLRALADRVGVSQTAIAKYEKNQISPDSQMLLKLSQALGVKGGYFFRQQSVTLSKPEYRKKSSLSQKQLDIIEGKILDQIERRLELEALFPVPPVHTFALIEGLPTVVENYTDIEPIAEAVRTQWLLGMNPIPELIDVLETNGIRVFQVEDNGEGKFDGLMANVNEHPVIVISSKWSGDRQRFTMAHELGHLLLNGRLSSALNEEKACHRFAGALLLPEIAIKGELGTYRTKLELKELLLLKQEYGISMSAALRRAYDLGIIKESYYKYLVIEFSQRGWRKNEPYPTDKEESHHFTQLIFHALAEEYIGESKAADLMNMSVIDFYNLRMIESNGASVHQ